MGFILVTFKGIIANIADQLYDSVLDGDILDVWIVNYQRKKGAKYFAWSMRGKVSEDSGSNDADDNSERELTFKITAGPKRGWTDITAETEAAMAYVFRGIGKIEGEAKNDGTDGGGLAWTAEDAGVGTLPEA